MVVEAFINGGYITTCPLCYAEDIKEMTGLPWTPAGSMAAEMLEEAKKQYPEG